MRDWRAMLGGLALWAVHFLGLYGVASLADMDAPGRWPMWTAIGLAVTAACLIGLGLIALRLRAGETLSRIARRVGLAGCALAALAILWQTLPLALSRPG